MTNIEIWISFIVFGGILTTVHCAEVIFQPVMIYNDVVDLVGSTPSERRPFVIAIREPNEELIDAIYVQGFRNRIQTGREGDSYKHGKIKPASRFRMLLRHLGNVLEIRMLDAEDCTSFLHCTFNIEGRSIGLMRTVSGTMRKERWDSYIDLPTNCGHHGVVTRVPPVDLCPPIAKPTSQRIIGGSPAAGGAHPWQVSIWEKEATNDVFTPICGGALIGSCWVMTAAHCFVQMNKDNFYVRAGDYYNRNDEVNDLFTDYESSRNFGVLRIISHRDYWSVPNARNDIVLLRLKSSDSDGHCVTFGPFIQPACLPTVKTVFADGKLCHITGWGANREKQSREDYSPCLQEAFVRLISNTVCQRGEKGYPPLLNYGRRILESMVCATSDDSEPTDTCQGDSGGPMICEGDSRGNDISIVWGITSWGRGCGENYGVYTRVLDFIPWIEERVFNTVKYNPHRP